MGAWERWRRRQPSRIRYALVPSGTVIVASGLATRFKVVEVRLPNQI